MKQVLILFCLFSFFALAAPSDLERGVLNTIDSTRELGLKDSGEIHLESDLKYNLNVIPFEKESFKGEKIVLKPKDSTRDPLYFITSEKKVVAGYREDKSSQLVIYSTSQDITTPVLREKDTNKVIAPEIHIGPHTLICEVNKQINPKQNRLCVVANAENCENLRANLASKRVTVDDNLLLSCNSLFNAVFVNKAFMNRPGDVSSNHYLSGAAADINMMTGESLFLELFSLKVLENKARGPSPLSYLHEYLNACKLYDSKAKNAAASAKSSGSL